MNTGSREVPQGPTHRDPTPQGLFGEDVRDYMVRDATVTCMKRVLEEQEYGQAQAAVLPLHEPCYWRLPDLAIDDNHLAPFVPLLHGCKTLPCLARRHGSPRHGRPTRVAWAAWAGVVSAVVPWHIQPIRLVLMVGLESPDLHAESSRHGMLDDKSDHDDDGSRAHV